MAWENTIRHPTSLFSMFKPERPLIDIPPSSHHTGAVVHGHIDPLRTPEDIPVRHPHHPPWDASLIDDMYHFTPFPIDEEHVHEQHRFPDVEDVGWDLGLVSPPSPSRRTMEMLPEVDNVQDSYDNMGMEDPPTVSPPSPSPRSLALLPDTDWQPDVMDDCPQLSPPSPIHCNSALPPLDPEFDTHSLFIEDSHTVASSPPVYSHGFPSPLAERLHTEHQALMSLRDGTIHAERTSRARNVALRGRERELGRAVAALRDAHTHTASDATITTFHDNLAIGLLSECSSTSGSPDHFPTPTAALHAYRTLATTVMLERTEEKRRRKKDKERLKELRVILGVGVHALLYLAGDTEAYGRVKFMDTHPISCTGDLGPAPASALHATTDLGMGSTALTLIPPALMLHSPELQGSGLLLAAQEPEVLLHEDPLYVTPQKTLHSESGIGLGLDLSVGSPTQFLFTALAERTVAMRRLVARMTMRRRYLGMRSLIEAGNMSSTGGKLLGGDSLKEANITQKQRRVGSALAREMIGPEELEAADIA